MPNSNAPWTADQLPDFSGKTVVITGANSGLGYETAMELARKGAEVVLACRTRSKAEAAKASILAALSEGDSGSIEVMELDLADLASVRSFAKNFLDRYEALHVLCNNAGVMALPYRKTSDGFEMQFGTNHLGHFALTGLLLERVLATQGARVVNVSSTGHRAGKICFEDLHWEKRRYSKWRAYGQSKLANLLFTYELQRKLSAARTDCISVACHPGFAHTELQATGPRMAGSKLEEWASNRISEIFAQSAAMGALPLLYAAAASEAKGGDYIGPDGTIEMKGYPTKVTSTSRSKDVEVAAKLWEVSESLTGLEYDALNG